MSKLQSFADSLIDIETMKSKEEIKKHNATAVKNEINRGASPDGIADLFSYNQLKDALSYYKIKDRTKLTRLKDMSIALVNEFSKKHKLELAGTTMDKNLKKALEKIEVLERENEILRFQNNQYKAAGKKKKKDKKKKKSKIGDIF